MILRSETPADAGRIAALATAAFLGHPYSDGTEAKLVADLRRSGGLLLSLVAEEAGQLCGHIAASPATVGGQAGWAAIGPLAVLPARQRSGIGSALMSAALAQLQGQGWSGVVLVGDAGYYGRFGFSSRPGLTAPGVPDVHVLGLGFASHPAPCGLIGFHPAFGL